MGLACLQLVESRISGNADLEPTEKVDFALKIWGNVTRYSWPVGFSLIVRRERSRSIRIMML